MPSITLTKIIKEEGNGRILVRFGKREREFANLQSLKDFVAATLNREVMEAIFLRLVIDRQPTLGNTTALEGRTLTIDTSAASWGTVS